MKPGARLAAAAEVMGEVVTRHRPVSEALADWGRTHRFAGSGDRAAIGNVAFDAMRRRLSIAARMGSDTPRALVLGAAMQALGLSAEQVVGSADGSPHALSPLSPDEVAGLTRDIPADVPDHVRADVPDWVWPSFVQAFGNRAVAEGEALAQRAPVDLRVNTLKADRERVLKALERYDATPTRFAPYGIRIAAPHGPGRTPNVEAEAGHGKGWFEVQDEASQIAAQLTGAGPRQQVLDLCAGAGGKTLAMAAAMQNTGQIYAYDSNRQQLRPIFERLQRAGVRNAQVMDAGDAAALAALGPRFDTVLVDAPCTGTGTWRRRPDAKWRLKLSNIAERQAEQRAVLALAADLVKPGGRLVYVTCSVLPEENGDIVSEFVAVRPELTVLPYAQAWSAVAPGEPPTSADGGSGPLLLTPASHATDGFFICVLQRAG